MSVKLKLILIWLLSIVTMLVLVAGVSSYLSWKIHQNEAREQIGHAFELLDITVHKDIESMKVNAKTLSEHLEVIAGISMITRYQDTRNYQPLIFDVEKKKLLSILSTQAYASGIDVISIYDGNSQLGAFFVVDDDDELIHPEGFGDLPRHKPDQTTYVGYLTYDQGHARPQVSHSINESFIESNQLPDFFATTLPKKPVNEPLTRIYDSSEGLIVEILQPIWRFLPGGKKMNVGFLRLARVMDEPYVDELSKSSALEFSVWFSESRQMGSIKVGDDLSQTIALSPLLKMESGGLHQYSWVERPSHFMGIHRQQLVGDESVAFIFNISKEQLQLDAVQARNAALIVLLFGLAVVPLGIFLLNRNISSPIRKLTSGVESLREGSFNRIEGLSGKNEFGFLAASFNRMADAIHDREKDLQQSEERFSLAMRGANDGLWDWNLETDEVYYSPRWKSMLGYEAGELDATLDTWATLVHPDDKDWVLKKVQDYLEGRANSFEAEMRMHHKDGHEVIVLSRAFLLSRESDGKQVRLVGTHVDITERKEAGIFLAALLDNIGEAMVSCDAQGSLVRFNTAAKQLHGLPLKPIRPEQWAEYYDLYQSDGRSLFRREEIPLFRALQGEHVHNVEMVVAPKNSSPRFLVANGQPLIDSSGQIFGAVVTMHDITDRKQLEEQLLQSQKMEAIGTLVGGIAHDFNNTLAAIQGNLYLAKRKRDDADVLNTKLNNIEKLSGRAAEMVRQLLTFARKDMVSTRPFSLTSFMKEEFKLARNMIPENIDYSIDLSDEELIIHGDATQLQQALMNLLSNARDAVRNTNQPKISCSLDSFTVNAEFQQRHPEIKGERVAHLMIEDNGCGISEGALAQIFVPFFTTKGVGEGTGLGLAMVYGSVQTHGGAIEVDSREGEGTVFHVYLPLSKDDEEAIDEPEEITIPGEGETILLADDETDMREAAGEVLSSLGYKVLLAADGEEAVELFKANADDVSLVISDLVMPNMGGVDAAKQIRLLNSEVPVIFATGYDKGQSATSSEKIERSMTISKPFSFETLSQLIRRMIEPN